MGQKVWVINDGDWGRRAGRKTGAAKPPPIEEGGERELAGKNPALSFSLSLFVWGGGQLYLGHYRLGAIYMASMVLLGSAFSALVLFWDTTRALGEGTAAAEKMPLLIMIAMILFLAGLVFWALNAVDAYYRTLQMRDEPYLGVYNELWPLCCSLLVPGWGQFLNAKPVRGGFFLLFGMMGGFLVFVLSVAWHVWPFLKVSPVSYLFEICIVTSLLYLPCVILIWAASAYDAFVTCRRGGKYALIPRSSAVLGLLLAISVGVQLFPEQYYLSLLETIHRETLQHHMEILQRLAQKALSLLSA